ncbi:MAG: mRNA surveillance protein pelota [Thaumarchaeota archaeon]|nr:mRNA surveillance protein pelota [Nitrososphaerota archaeon]
MIVKNIKDNTYLVVPEDSDDLFSLRRIIRNNDLLIIDTSRVVKHIKEFSRPDRGERIKVRIVMNVENISLDAAVDRLRINGVIVNSNNQLVPRGLHHSHTIKPGDLVSIEKNKWEELDIVIVNKESNVYGFVLVSIDRTEVAVGRISGTHLKMVSNVYSGFSGKMYRVKEENIDFYFNDIIKVLFNIKNENDSILIFGPGNVKQRFHNYLVNNHNLSKTKISVVDGVDAAGQDGIYVFLRSSMVNDVIGSSKIAIVSSILNEMMRRISTNDNRVAMGFKDVFEATKFKAVESLMFSNSVFAQASEGAVVDLLNNVEVYGAKTFALDSSTDVGKQIYSLGGIVALLRYELR